MPETETIEAEAGQTEPIEQTQEAEKVSDQEADAVKDAAKEKEAERSYSQKEVDDLVAQKLKETSAPWEKFGKPQDVEARLARLSIMEQVLQNGRINGVAKPPESPETAALRKYMSGIFPGIDRLERMEAAIFAQQEAARAAVNNANIGSLKELTKEAGYAEEHFPFINDLVAYSVTQNQEDLKNYQMTGDFNIIKKHFDAVQSGFLSKMVAKADADYLDKKAPSKNLPKRMPSGGVPAPTSKKEKMTKEQFLQGAFETLTGKEE